MISVNHPDMNGADAVTRKDKEPFVVRGPGEYEINDLFIEGFSSKTTYGGEERCNTLYTFELDGLEVAYFGALGESDISPEIKEALGEIDVLFIPIGGDGTLTAQEAYKLAVKRESAIIVPIMFGATGEKDALKAFLNESGNEGLKSVDKLTLKKKDIAGKQGEVIVLKPSL
jgi:L-ascorbate metabolism protein UlaG (beta-lactamase superfamily)